MKNKAILITTITGLMLAGGQAYAGGKGHGKFMRMFDINKDGEVTEAEFNTASAARFKRMDSNANGSVSLDEFKAYAKQRRSERRQRKLTRIDTDGNGSISKQEFTAFKMKKIEKGFNHLDANGDGEVSKDEFINGKRRKHKRGCFSPDRIFSRLDANDDGKITREESNSKWSKWFARLDANSDKRVTADEVKQARHRQHK
jgi:Ca2+-binding EF-hand superfamily protein